MTYTTRTVPLLLLGLLACSSGGNVNIGDTQSLGGKLSDYAAEWDGYAEAYAFKPSNSDHIHMSLDQQGHGTLQVGTDALLPPPTDPNVGYPSGATVDLYKIGFPTELSGGVRYPVHAARVEANRIQFGLLPSEFYAAWCALQTPYYVLSGYMGGGGGAAGFGVPVYAYSCMPGSGGGSSGVPPNVQCTVQNSSVDGGYSDQPIDCGKFYLCSSGVCACTATSCISSPTLPADTAPAGYPAELDGALDSSGKALTGTLNLNGTRITVHLTRK